ncbi:MAG: hypothetical protein NZL93_07315, partial [Chthoniobacterales bacterium]|nr:hypothetical protein [Chthoniobacterales bacterium]
VRPHLTNISHGISCTVFIKPRDYQNWLQSETSQQKSRSFKNLNIEINQITHVSTREYQYSIQT